MASISPAPPPSPYAEHWAQVRLTRLGQMKEDTWMDSDISRPLVLGFLGGSFIGSGVALAEFIMTIGKKAGMPLQAISKDLFSSVARKAVVCSVFFGLYQSTLTAMDKLGVVSEWEMHAAVPATIVGALPFLRKASRAHWPIFAALVALDRWDKYRIKERMSEEGLELGPAPSPAERQ